VRITDLRFDRLVGYADAPPGFQAERQSRPTDMHPEHNAESALGWAACTEDGRLNIDHVPDDRDRRGRQGRGRATRAVRARHGDWPPAGTPQLVGEDALAHERLWDKMYRLLVHGRKGLEMQAIRAVDVALWDIEGRWAVHRLLGGPTRTSLPVYASMPG
jgi:L-rhamnonate dehydratase